MDDLSISDFAGLIYQIIAKPVSLIFIYFWEAGIGKELGNVLHFALPQHATNFLQTKET